MDLFMLFLAEILGTAILILIGNGVVSNLVYKRTNGSNSGFITIIIVWGLAVFVGATVGAAVAAKGGQLNPALSLMLTFDGSLTAAEFFISIFGQLLGAMTGQLIVNAIYYQNVKNLENYEVVKNAHFTDKASISKKWNAFLNEYFGTVVLLAGLVSLTVLAKNGSDKVDPNIFGTKIQPALIIMAIGGAFGGITGYALNTFRDLGPRIVYQIMITLPKNRGKYPNANWGYSWVPILAPVLAGVTIGLFTLIQR